MRGGGGGGWMGTERSLGGMSRTFGMQRFEPPGGEQPAGRIERSQVRRVLRQMAPYWRQWLVITLCITLSQALGVLPPLAVRGIIDHAIPSRNTRLLNLLVGAIVGLNILVGLIGVLQSYLNARVGQEVMFDLRNALYRHLQRMSLAFYTETRAGEIVSRVNNDVGAVQSVVAGTLVGILSNVLTVIATAAVIFTLDWRLAVLAIVIVPTFIFPTRVVGRVRRRLSGETQARQADLLAFMQERLHIGGMLLTKMFGQEHADADTFGQRNRDVMELSIRQAMAGRWLFMSLSIISVAGPALIYWFGGRQAIAGEITVGTIIAFVAYLTNLYRPMAQLANVYVDVQGSLAIFERIFEYLDLKPEVDDRPGALRLARVEGHSRFEEVSFSYPPGDRREETRDPRPETRDQASRRPARPSRTGDAGGAGSRSRPAAAEGSEARPEVRQALRGVSFEILPGQRVALVGPSGAGKTTVTYLLPRLYDPTSGRITLDGHDLRDLDQGSLRSHIGMVTQETFLFHSTVRENLLYARPGATEEEIVAAARASNIHERILELPDRYETVVGERAFRLSGGEKQRLAIARALLKDPRILVLDEATSNLDATSEYLIQTALETLLRGRTSLIIAHRLSTILTADQILVLEAGRLVEAGRHEELLRRNGLYATLYRQQFGKVVEQTLAGAEAPAEPPEAAEAPTPLPQPALPDPEDALPEGPARPDVE